MTEYIPCILKREMDTTSFSFEVTSLGNGATICKPLGSPYIETLMPCNMDEFVALMQGKRTLLKGPFKTDRLPGWAKNWFKKKEKSSDKQASN